jgi:hypothetical protein
MIITDEILAAVQGRLVGNAGVIALVPSTKIGNYLKQDVGYPHIQYDLDFESMNVKDEDSQIVTLQIDIWANYRGSKECLTIADAVRTAFDGIPVTIASGNGFGCIYDTMDPSQEPEGTTYRCSMLFTMYYSDL